MNNEATDQPNQPEQLTTRRDFLAGAATAAAASAAVASLISAAAPAQEAAPVRPLGGSATGKIFVETDTTYGRVQGIQTTGVKEFKGIPYGASTGGRNRFMPPKKPVAWKGVRECLAHGQISPQALTDLRSDYGMMIHWDYQPGGMGEDCLNLNIWTPGLKDGAKRPVLVSFHGGGFTTGSGNAIGYEAPSWRASAMWWWSPSIIGWPHWATPSSPIWARRPNSPMPAARASWISPPRSNGFATTSKTSAAIRTT